PSASCPQNRLPARGRLAPPSSFEPATRKVLGPRFAGSGGEHATPNRHGGRRPTTLFKRVRHVHRDVMVRRVCGQPELWRYSCLLPPSAVPEQSNPHLDCPPLIGPAGSKCRPAGPTGLVRLDLPRGARICMGKK